MLFHAPIISAIADGARGCESGRAFSSGCLTNPRMEDESWRARLQGILDRDGRSMRDVSLSAGLSPGYLHGVLKDGKDSTIDRIAAVAAALDVSLAYILVGLEVSPDTVRLIGLLESDPARRDALLRLLRKGALD